MKPHAPVALPAKLTIGALHHSELTVSAQYNPKEVKVSQPVKWLEAQPENQQPDALALEFGGQQPQELSIELLFDGFERGGRIGDSTVIELVQKLKQLASVRDPFSSDPQDRRPYFCVLTWGVGGMPPLRCVIEAIATNYQMFSPTGAVLRATVALQLKEADSVARYRGRKPSPRNRATEYA